MRIFSSIARVLKILEHKEGRFYSSYIQDLQQRIIHFDLRIQAFKLVYEYHFKIPPKEEEQVINNYHKYSEILIPAHDYSLECGWFKKAGFEGPDTDQFFYERTKELFMRDINVAGSYLKGEIKDKDKNVITLEYLLTFEGIKRSTLENELEKLDLKKS